jgi:Zn-dependent alcohol dehydrogenase
VTSFIPSYDRCRWCASGQQNLCDNGVLMLEGCQLDDSFRMHLDGADVAQVGLGDVVIVMGAGGIGINAVQGARRAGASQIVAGEAQDHAQGEA